MTESQYEDALLALGCKNVTTQSQSQNHNMKMRYLH
jgi:hypothetical protein